MKTVGLAATACALLVSLAGCGGGPVRTDVVELTPGATAERARAGSSLPHGATQTPLGNGLSIAVSQPVSFVPTEAAYPDAERAVGFEVTVRNDGPAGYQPTLLALTARAGEQTTQQVIDPTRGYAGMVGAAELAPGHGMRFSVAFAVPPTRCALRVDVRPDPALPTVVTVFDGAV